MKAVLCALDFSEKSDDVVRVALEMAAKRKSNLVVLYAYRLLQAKTQDVADYRNNVEKRAKADFESLAKKLKINGDVPYEFRPEIGFLSDRIDVYLKKNPVDLIVIGQRLAHAIHEHKGLSFEDFLHYTSVPVLVVPNGYKA